ncbi:MAG: tetratricopeptide repeat protein [Moraxellaceae bacterium]|nr:tetratricopeptide repeat protein [Moraxellaceae bacterium]
MLPRALPRLSRLALVIATCSMAGNALADSAIAEANASAADDALLQKGERLLNQRQANSAWNLLSAQEDELGGNPKFDYLLGRAALESGRTSEAAFAFERCLATNPKDGPCRVQMARTHLALGETQSARTELETIKGTEPPVEVQAMVSQYLGAVSQRETREKRRINSWVQVGLGADSNVNSATDASQVVFPTGPFAGLPFKPSQAADDSFYKGEAGVRAEFGLSPALSVVADATVGGRGNNEVSQFNYVTGDAGFGLAWRAGHNSLLVKLQGQKYVLDSEDYRDSTGVYGQYQFAVDDSAAFSVYLLHNALDYRVTTPNAERNTVGVGYSRAFPGLASAPAFYVGLNASQETSDDSSKPQLDTDSVGLRAGGSLTIAKQLRLTGSLNYETREAGGPQPVFIEAREDKQIDLSLGLIYAIDRQVSLRPVYTYTVNDSNVVLSEFDRHQFSLDIRYEF